MKKQYSSRVWYVYPCDAHTNRSFFIELNSDLEFDCSVEDIDGVGQKINKILNLARLNSYDEIQFLKRSKKQLNLKFKIFAQDDPDGKIYRWPFDKEVKLLILKNKSRKN